MHFRKTVSLLLVLSLVLGLSACGTTPDPTTAPTVPTTVPVTDPPTAPPTEPPTEPAPDPAVLYSDAVKALNDHAAFILSGTIQRTVTVGTTTFGETSTLCVTYSDYGSESFAATATETIDYGAFDVSYTEHFQEGTLYTMAEESNFKSPMTAEEYTTRYMPPVMLDTALYASITVDGNELHFSDAVSGESWLVPEFAELEKASGTAILDDGGLLTGYTYSVTFSLGGAQIQYDIDMEVEGLSSVELTPPDEAPEYIETEYADAARMVLQATAFLADPSSTRSLTGTITESVMTQAGSAMRTQRTTINSWGLGKEYMGNVDISVSLMTASGSDTYKQEEKFRNGKYTVSANGSTPKTESGVTDAIFSQYCIGALSSAVSLLTMFNGCTASDFGTILFLELNLDEEVAKAMNSSICNIFWNDPDFLNDLAEKYETREISGYLSIDKITGLPISMGFQYEGCHTIDGDEYLLTMQNDQSFDLVSMSAYESIAEEPPIPPEPDEKATPLFYHVTGENGQEMWLLGTIHVGDARTSYLPQTIYDAFDSADALAVEFNSKAFEKAIEDDEELSGKVSEFYFYQDGSMAQDHVKDEELYHNAEKLMMATGNYHMNVPYLKISAWSNAIDNFHIRQSYNLCSTQGVDNQLLHRAEDQEKTILDVESGLFQLEMLMGFSDGLAELLLSESVSANPFASAESTRELFEMWCAGDEAALIARLNEEPDNSEMTEEEIAYLDEYNNAMGTDRNDDMLDVAVGYLESGDVVFYAVGLAHLLAEDGLVNTLRDAGYTVELVTFE